MNMYEDNGQDIVEDYYNGLQLVSGEELMLFYLADEEYGIDILRVREIRGWEAVSKIPNSPDYVVGVLNLRGAIVPIVDLRIRFSLPVKEYTAMTVVIIVSVESNVDHKERRLGIVVDSISNVVDKSRCEFQRAPAVGASVELQYITGLAVYDESMIMLMDLDKLLDVYEFH